MIQKIRIVFVCYKMAESISASQPKVKPYSLFSPSVSFPVEAPAVLTFELSQNQKISSPFSSTYINEKNMPEYGALQRVQLEKLVRYCLKSSIRKNYGTSNKPFETVTSAKYIGIRSGSFRPVSSLKNSVPSGVLS